MLQHNCHTQNTIGQSCKESLLYAKRVHEIILANPESPLHRLERLLDQATRTQLSLAEMDPDRDDFPVKAYGHIRALLQEARRVSLHTHMHPRTHTYTPTHTHTYTHTHTRTAHTHTHTHTHTQEERGSGRREKLSVDFEKGTTTFVEQFRLKPCVALAAYTYICQIASLLTGIMV